MIEPVDLMEPVQLDLESQQIDMYWESNEHILEPVEKGRRYQCLVSDDVTFATSNKDSKKGIIDHKVKHIVDTIKQNVPKDSLLDGYLMSKDYNETLRILESNNVESNSLRFVLMDIILWKGEKISEAPYFDRRKIINRLNIDKTKIFFDNKKKTYLDLRQEYNAFYFKSYESNYVFGKSSKWKLIRNPQIYFGVILDIIEGSGKFKNMCGSIKIGQYKNGTITEITNLSGLDRDERVNLFNNKKNYINTIIEFRAFGKNEKTYEDAKFVKIRKDKNLEDCIF